MPQTKTELTSIRSLPDGTIDRRSSEGPRKAFNIIINPIPDMSLEVAQHAPDGDSVLAAQCMKVLIDHYPGYHWIVEIDDRPSVGMINVYNQDINVAIFSNMPYGYRIALKDAYTDPDLKCVMKAGGEILERARLARGKKRDEKVQSVDGVPQKNQPLKVIH